MFSSHQDHCAMPAYSKHTDANHHHSLGYASSNNQHTCIYELQHAGILPLSETDSSPSGPVWMVSPWYAFYKVQCNVVHTSYSPSQLYCTAQVSVTVFATSNIEVAIFRVNASRGPHINLALGRVWVWVCVRGTVGKQPELSAKAHTVL